MEENHEPSPSLRNELELLTEEQLSQHLKICKRQLYNMRMRGEIPYLKLGRVVRYRVGEVADRVIRRNLGRFSLIHGDSAGRACHRFRNVPHVFRAACVKSVWNPSIGHTSARLPPPIKICFMTDPDLPPARSACLGRVERKRSALRYARHKIPQDKQPT